MKMKDKINIEYVGKCLFIDEKDGGVLVVGDLHVGFEDNLIKSGISIIGEVFDETLKYFDRIFYELKSEGKKVNKIILLGDVKHSFGRPKKYEYKYILKLLNYLLGKINKSNVKRKIIIVRGNHDNYVENIIKVRGVCVLNYYCLNLFKKVICFCHGNKKILKIIGKNSNMIIMGHGHPAIRIDDKNKSELYKCFLEGKYKNKNIIIVPSFMEHNKGTDPRENNLGIGWNFKINNFYVGVVSEDAEKLEVLKFGKLKDFI